MRAITLWRPWPWAILNGKGIENRSWPPPSWMQGRALAIHAGLKWDDEGAEFIRSLGLELPAKEAHPSSVIVGVAQIAGHVDEATVAELADAQRRWFCGPFGWVLRSVQRLRRPVPCRGAQSLWHVPMHVEEAILAQLGSGRSLEKLRF